MRISLLAGYVSVMAVISEERLKIESTLARPSLIALRNLLGPVIAMRLSAPVHDCNLVRLLREENDRILALWERPCALYLNALRSPQDAAEKFKQELAGFARNCAPAQFDAAIGDFFAEIAVVAELSRKGFSDFIPIVPVQAKKGKKLKAPDYSCHFISDAPESCASDTDRRAYVEVKNLRAPIGITDAFAEELKVKPELSRYGIRLQHNWDNTVTSEQRADIRAFLTTVADRPVNQPTSVTLAGDVHVQVWVTEEAGKVYMTRPIGGDYPWGPFIEQSKFFDKATEKIKDGIGQLSVYPDGTHILALNVQSPDGLFPSEYGAELQTIVQRESEGKVHCLVFHHYHFLEP